MNFSIPLPSDRTDQWHKAVTFLGASTPSEVVLCSGLGGRTLSGPVVAPNGVEAWLRVMVASRPEGKLWEGAVLAERSLSEAIPRPNLLAEYSWTSEGVTQAFIHRIPRFIPALEGTDLMVKEWRTAHGDLHWANITKKPLQLFDWEGWGGAPAGYDAAVLLAYSLPAPATASKVREVFEDLLRTETGRLAQLVICAEIIQASERDEIHARLRPYAEALAAELAPQ